MRDAVMRFLTHWVVSRVIVAVITLAIAAVIIVGLMQFADR